MHYDPAQPWFNVGGSTVQSHPAGFAGPGNFQNINGRMVFVPSAQLKAPSFPNAQEQASPYAMNWNYKEVNREAPSNYQILHQGGFTVDKIKSSKNAVAEKLTTAIPTQIASKLPVHFTDNRLRAGIETTDHSITVFDIDGNPITGGATGNTFVPGISDQISQSPQDLSNSIYQSVTGGFSYNWGEQQRAISNQMVVSPNYYAKPDQAGNYGAPNAVPGYPYYDSHSNYHGYYPGYADFPSQQGQQDLVPVHNQSVAYEQASGPIMDYNSYYSKEKEVQVVEVPCNVTRYVPKVETKIVEKIVEIPGDEKIPVPRAVEVETNVITPVFTNVEVSLPVSKSIIPEIHQTSDIVEVEVFKYVPEVEIVDIYVPRPVAIPIKNTGIVDQKEVPNYNVSAEQLQATQEKMNPYLVEIEAYNEHQRKIHEELIAKAEEVAKYHGLPVKEGIIYSLENEPIVSFSDDQYGDAKPIDHYQIMQIEAGEEDEAEVKKFGVEAAGEPRVIVESEEENELIANNAPVYGIAEHMQHLDLPTAMNEGKGETDVADGNFSPEEVESVDESSSSEIENDEEPIAN